MSIQGHGQEGNLYWWEGVVEDNLDPDGAGRCRVRVLAQNSALKTDIATEQLPWAYPIMPLNNPHGKVVALKPGTRVTGFYRDGPKGNDLVMMGTINTGYENPGQDDNYNEFLKDANKINLSAPVKRKGYVGFIDDRVGAGGPIDGQPKKTVVSGDLTTYEEISDYGTLESNEINTPRLARGVTEGTITESHASAENFVTTTEGASHEEPSNPYNAQYPFNTVEESDSGHLREIDDTPGAERIKETHRTGTFHEIHPDGTRVVKVVGDDWSVSIRDKHVKVEGACAVHVVGQADFYCESDIRVKTDQNAIIDVAMDATTTVAGDATTTVAGDATTTVEGTATVHSLLGTDVTSLGPIAIVGGSQVSIAAAGTIIFEDETATAFNVDDIVRDIKDGGKTKQYKSLSKIA